MKKLFFVYNPFSIDEVFAILNKNILDHRDALDLLTFDFSLYHFFNKKYGNKINVFLLNNESYFENDTYLPNLLNQFSMFLNKNFYSEVLIYNESVENFVFALSAFYKKIHISYFYSEKRKMILESLEIKNIKLISSLASDCFYVKLPEIYSKNILEHINSNGLDEVNYLVKFSNTSFIMHKKKCSTLYRMHANLHKKDIRKMNIEPFFDAFLEDTKLINFNRYHEILIVIGTRPEAIKMYPVIQELLKIKNIKLNIFDTGQHKDVMKKMLDYFSIKPNYTLEIGKEKHELYEIMSSILSGVSQVLKNKKFDYVFVHGDTSTTIAASLAANYYNIPIVHIEAGLRTNDIYSPFPEEINRRLVSVLAMLHFSPTIQAADNLSLEGVHKKNIFITGNTAIDSFRSTVDLLKNNSDLNLKLSLHFSFLNDTKKLIVVTAHRRENIGQGLINICNAIIKLSKRNDLQIVYPVHMNPNVYKIVQNSLQDIDNVYIIPAQDYPAFVYLLNKSYIVMTDSGGIQEEVAGLKPVIILRHNTERQEAVSLGTSILTGTDTDKITYYINKLLDDSSFYSTMSNKPNPYESGFSGKKIVKYFLEIANSRVHVNSLTINKPISQRKFPISDKNLLPILSVKDNIAVNMRASSQRTNPTATSSASHHEPWIIHAINFPINIMKQATSSILDTCCSYLDSLIDIAKNYAAEVVEDCPSYFPKEHPTYWRNGGSSPTLFQATAPMQNTCSKLLESVSTLPMLEGPP